MMWLRCYGASLVGNPTCGRNMTTVPGMKLSFSMFNPLKNWDEGVVGVWCVCFFKMCLTMFNPPQKWWCIAGKSTLEWGKAGMIH